MAGRCRVGGAAGRSVAPRAPIRAAATSCIWVQGHKTTECPRCHGPLEDVKARRQVTRKGFATKREAEAFVKKQLGEREAGTYVEPTNLTVAEFLTKRWLPDTKNTRKPSTHSSYVHHVDAYLVPALGTILLRHLDAGHINAMYAELAAPAAASAVRGSPRPRAAAFTTPCGGRCAMPSSGISSSTTQRRRPTHRRSTPLRRRCMSGRGSSYGPSSATSRTILCSRSGARWARPACGAASSVGCSGGTWTSSTPRSACSRRALSSATASCLARRRRGAAGAPSRLDPGR